MFALLRRDDVLLRPPRLQRSCVFATHTEQQNFSHIPEVETHPAAIRAAIFPDFVPNDVTSVFEARVFSGFSLKSAVASPPYEFQKTVVAQHLQLLADFRPNTVVLRIERGESVLKSVDV